MISWFPIRRSLGEDSQKLVDAFVFGTGWIGCSTEPEMKISDLVGFGPNIELYFVKDSSIGDMIFIRQLTLGYLGGKPFGVQGSTCALHTGHI